MEVNIQMHDAGGRPEAKAACGTTQLAGWVEAGIEVAIQAMRIFWEEHDQ